MRYSPVRILEIVRIVERPAGEETVIIVKSAGREIRETFVGAYVEVLDQETNKVQYAYDYDQLMKTHALWEGVENGWYHSEPVDAYQVDTEGELFAGREGGTQHVNISDWIYRTSDGKVKCLKNWIFELAYDLDSVRPVPREPE